MFDDIMFSLPESLEAEEFVTGTYLIRAPAGEDPWAKAAALAVEQTTGTWVPVPEETPELRRAHVGRVVALWEVPDHEYEVPRSVETRTYVVQIAYPHVNFGAQIPMLLSTVIGNISMFGPLKLLDITFPKSFIRGFQGPKFGVEGVRRILGVHDRPLLNNMIKPCTGFPPEVGARLFLEAARGGCDIIKDDELIANPSFSPLEQRVRLYMEAERKAFEEKGGKTLYTVNVTDRADKVRDNALRCIDAGANALMINYLTAGISVLQALAEDDQIGVPILAHLDFAGTMYESPHSGLSSHIILGKLARMAGADMVVYPSRIDQLDTHGPGHITLKLEEANPRGPPDRVVEKQHSGRTSRKAPRSSTHPCERAIEQDRAGELLTAA